MWLLLVGVGKRGQGCFRSGDLFFTRRPVCVRIFFPFPPPSCFHRVTCQLYVQALVKSHEARAFGTESGIGSVTVSLHQGQPDALVHTTWPRGESIGPSVARRDIVLVRLVGPCKYMHWHQLKQPAHFICPTSSRPRPTDRPGRLVCTHTQRIFQLPGSPRKNGTSAIGCCRLLLLHVFGKTFWHMFHGHCRCVLYAPVEMIRSILGPIVRLSGSLCRSSRSGSMYSDAYICRERAISSLSPLSFLQQHQNEQTPPPREQSNKEASSSDQRRSKENFVVGVCGLCGSHARPRPERSPNSFTISSGFSSSLQPSPLFD